VTQVGNDTIPVSLASILQLAKEGWNSGDEK